jgi:hypothetical protein
MDSRQWSEFLSQSGIQADRSVKSFTPDWVAADWTVEPVGEISYMDFGAIVMIWWDSGSDLTGTSNSTAMSWAAGALPALIRPSSTRQGTCIIVDATGRQSGFFTVLSTGAVEFALGTVSGTSLIYSPLSFSSGGATKGLSRGMLISYAK